MIHTEEVVFDDKKILYYIGFVLLTLAAVLYFDHGVSTRVSQKSIDNETKHSVYVAEDEADDDGGDDGDSYSMIG